MSEKSKWYISLSGQLIGPYETNELLDLFKAGDLKTEDSIYKTGEDKWGKIHDFPELALASSAPAPVHHELPKFVLPQTPEQPLPLKEEITASGVQFLKEDTTESGVKTESQSPLKIQFKVENEKNLAHPSEVKTVTQEPLQEVKKETKLQVIVEPQQVHDDVRYFSKKMSEPVDSHQILSEYQAPSKINLIKELVAVWMKPILAGAFIFLGVLIGYQTYQGQMFSAEESETTVASDDALTELPMSLGNEKLEKPSSATAAIVQRAGNVNQDLAALKLEDAPAEPSEHSNAMQSGNLNEVQTQVQEQKMQAQVPAQPPVEKVVNTKIEKKQVSAKKSGVKGKANSFQVQQERKKLFKLISSMQKQTDQLRKKEKWSAQDLKKWKMRFKEIQPSVPTKGKPLLFAQEWKDVKRLHDQWLKSADQLQSSRKIASVNSNLSELKKKTLQMKKKVQNLSLDQ